MVVYCPTCGSEKVKVEYKGEKDFDEGGWYKLLYYTCLSPFCRHQWKKKAPLTVVGRRGI